MKNFIEIKTNSIHPFYTPEGWIYLMMPVSVINCFLFLLEPESVEGYSIEEVMIYLN